MTKRLLKQTLQLATDRALFPYWIARSMIASVFFLFGILLRNAGVANLEVILSLIGVGVGQGALLIALERVPEGWGASAKNKLIAASALIAATATLVMTSQGLGPVLFTVTTITMVPLLRSMTHQGIIHLRERKDWEFGTNTAFVYANESSKGIGALLITIMGYLSSIGSQWVAMLLFGLLSLSLLVALRGEFEEENPVLESNRTGSVGRDGWAYIALSVFHNGVFSGSKSVLSLVLFDLLTGAHGVESAITTIAGGLSIAMVVGMIIANRIGPRIESRIKSRPRASMLTVSIAIHGVLITTGFAMMVLSNMSAITPVAAGYTIAFVIALLMASGGFFSLGTMKHLETLFGANRLKRKTVLHYAWTGSTLSPAVYMSVYLVLEWQLPSLEAGTFAILLGAITEGLLVIYSGKISGQANDAHRQCKTPAQTSG